MKTDYLITAFVIAAACAFPAGLVLWVMYPASSWWVLSVASLIFFMAG